MKKTLFPLGVLLLLNYYNTDAQSTQQTVKNKVDSIKASTINKAVNDPVGTGRDIMNLIRHKPATPNPVAQSPTVSVNNGTSTANVPVTNNVPATINTPVTNNAATTINASVTNNLGLINGNSKAINNGLIFSIVQCAGDKAAQTVTITFTLSNPNKVNQIVTVGTLSAYDGTNRGSAIDANGNSVQIEKVSLSSVTNKVVTVELPTGITIRGTITLINALPTSSNLQYFKIPIRSANETGGSDRQGTMIEERNIPVAWNN